jgi:hypothetical protein
MYDAYINFVAEKYTEVIVPVVWINCTGFYFRPFTIDDDIISIKHNHNTVLVTIHGIRPNLKILFTVGRHFTMVFDDDGKKYSCHFDGTIKQFKKSVEFVLKQHDGIL